MRFKGIGVAVILVGALWVAHAHADPVPAVFPVTAASLNAGQSYQFTFALFDVPSGGMRLWSERKSYVLPATKKITHQLGSVNPAGNPIAPLFLDRQLWVEAAAGAAKFPRVKLGVVPYAVRSEMAGNIEGQITEAQVDSGSAPAGTTLTADGAGGASWQAVPGSGDVTAVLTLPGSGLAGGADAGEITLFVDTTAVQSRVTGDCGSGSSIRQVHADGTVACETDDLNGPHLHSGADVTSGTVATARLSVGTTTGTVAAGDHGHPGMGDITGVQTPVGSGLSGGADTGSPSLAVDPGPGLAVTADGVAVDFAGPGAAVTAARSDHNHAVFPNNTALGQQALFSVTTGQGNTGLGRGALFSNDQGAGNTATGDFALSSNTGGSRNTATGTDALRYNLSGTDNAAVGFEALAMNASGTQNAGFGFKALRNNAGDYNTAVGAGALELNTGGFRNAGFGFNALRNNVDGRYNTAAGNEALAMNSAGYNNAGFGNLALAANADGFHNTALGNAALRSNLSGNVNTAVGTTALYANVSGSNGTAVGAEALFNSLADGNTALGHWALRSTVNGAYNTAVGHGALNYNVGGHQNTALGLQAGAVFGASTENFSSTFIGALSGPGTTGSLVNATAVGYNAKVGQSNSLVLGGTGSEAVNVGIGTTTPGYRLHVVGDFGLEGGQQFDASLRQKLNLWGSNYGIGIQSGRQYFRADAGEGFAWYSGGAHSDTTDDPGAGGLLMMRLAGNGDLTVTGNLSKGGGSFKIDHPLDPTNRYLSHSFVESPDMMNIYNGNITTDGRGYATVELPAWFGALNRDFRYQLTVIGSGETWARARIAEEISENRFVIQTDVPGARVSWQVTGIRQDPYANEHRIPVEEEKPVAERGKCLHAEACGEQLAQGRQAAGK